VVLSGWFIGLFFLFFGVFGKEIVSNENAGEKGGDVGEYKI